MLANILMSRALGPVRRSFPRSWRTWVTDRLHAEPYQRLINANGSLRSTARLSNLGKVSAATNFMHREKSDVAMAATTSWYGGDYFEFGSVGLNTFRSFLSAFHIAGLETRFPDTHFYAFDVFGNLTSPDEATASEMKSFDQRTGYFSDQFSGDEIARHRRLIEQHKLFVHQCHLVQGFFADTLTAQRVAQLQSEGRQIGFAFIDCNFEEFYKQVFEFIFDLMAPNSYIYMDEYFQSSGAAHLFDDFADRLRERRDIECMYVRSAGAFGGMFRLRPVRTMEPLRLAGGIENP